MKNEGTKPEESVITGLFDLERHILILRFSGNGREYKGVENPPVITNLGMAVAYGSEKEEKKLFIGWDEKGRLTAHVEQMYVDPTQLFELSDAVDVPPQKHLRGIKTLLPLEISLSDLSPDSERQLTIYATPPSTFGNLTLENGEGPNGAQAIPMRIESFVEQLVDGEPSFYYFSDPTSGIEHIALLLKNIGFADTGLFLVFREHEGVSAMRSAEHTFQKLVDRIIESDSIYGKTVNTILAESGQQYNNSIIKSVLKLRVLVDIKARGIKIVKGIFAGRKNSRMIRGYQAGEMRYATATADREVSEAHEDAIHQTPAEKELYEKQKEVRLRAQAQIEEEEKIRQKQIAVEASQKALLEKKASMVREISKYQLQGFGKSGPILGASEETVVETSPSYLAEEDMLLFNTLLDAPYADFIDFLMRDNLDAIHNTFSQLISFAKDRISDEALRNYSDYEKNLPFVREVIKRLWLYSQYGALKGKGAPGSYNDYDRNISKIYQSEALGLWKKYLHCEFTHYKETKKFVNGFESFRDVMVKIDPFLVIFSKIIDLKSFSTAMTRPKN